MFTFIELYIKGEDINRNQLLVLTFFLGALMALKLLYIYVIRD